MRWLKNIMREPLPLADDPFNATASTLTIAALESALMKSDARLAPIREVWEKWHTIVNKPFWGLDHDVDEFNSDCWQAIRKAMEDQP